MIKNLNISLLLKIVLVTALALNPIFIFADDWGDWFDDEPVAAPKPKPKQEQIAEPEPEPANNNSNNSSGGWDDWFDDTPAPKQKKEREPANDDYNYSSDSYFDMPAAPPKELTFTQKQKFVMANAEAKAAFEACKNPTVTNLTTRRDSCDRELKKLQKIRSENATIYNAIVTGQAELAEGMPLRYYNYRGERLGYYACDSCNIVRARDEVWEQVRIVDVFIKRLNVQIKDFNTQIQVSLKDCIEKAYERFKK
jgi:hypothetical protein